MSRRILVTMLPVLATAICSCGRSGSPQPLRAEPVAYVAVTATSSWSAPEAIGARDLGVDSTPTAVALDARGDAVAVWSESTFDGHSVVYLVRASVHPQGGHWLPPSTLSRFGLSPHVAVDAAGNAVAAWESATGVPAAMLLAGGVWAAPQILEPGSDEAPEVASDARGDAIVVWSRFERNRSGRGYTRARIQAAVRPAGGAFAPAQSISGSNGAYNPHVAMNARGDAIVAWEVDTSHACLVQAVFRRRNGRWSAPRTLSDRHPGCPSGHRVAIDGRGDAIVVWNAQRGQTEFVDSAGRNADGRWTPRYVVGSAPIIGESPDVAMNGQGDATVVWSQSTLVSDSVIRARTRPAGRGWNAVQAIPHASGLSPSIAVDARGDALVAWWGSGTQVAARPAGGRWGNARTLSMRPVSGNPPLAAVDAHGDAVVVWRDDTSLGDASIETAWHPSLFR